MARKLGVEVLEFVGKLFETARFASLPLQRTDLPLHLADEVGDANQVLLGIFEFAQGFLLLRLVFGDAGGFLKNQTPILGFAGEDLRDVALGHDAVTGPANACAHEQLLDVFEPAGRLVDEIFAATVAKHTAGDGDLIVSDLNPGGGQMFAIHTAYGQGYFCHAQRLAPIGAVENDIRHLAAAERFGRLFAQYPTYSVRHIGLTTPIGANDRRDPGLEVERRLIRKGFEA